MSSATSRSALLVLLLMVTALPAPAHRGAVGIALPVDGIAVDGDLSDWPDGLPEYAIADLDWGVPPEGAEDLSGSFRVAFGPGDGALYVAVVVEDDAIVVGAAGDESRDTQDGCTVLLDLAHEEGEYEGTFGRGLGTEASEYSVRGQTRWTHTKAELAHFAASFLRTKGQHQYEFRIDVEQASQDGAMLTPGRVVGLNVELLDCDPNEGVTTAAWKAPTWRWLYPMGDIIAARGDQLGRLRGAVRWADGEAVARAKVEVRLLSDSTRWVTVAADRQGRYEVHVPAGEYTLELASGAGPAPAMAEAHPGQTTAVADLFHPMPEGHTVRLQAAHTTETQGTAVPAGRGTSRGAWRNLEVADGLSDPTVEGIAMGAAGDVWFATTGGACRYDGETFTLYTEIDGLASNDLISVLRDRTGGLWFGTHAGLSRYDGHSLATYTRAEGLAGDRVLCLMEDSRGHIWAGTDGGVSRFEGEFLTSYTVADGLADNWVEALLEDSEGRVWLGTWRGLSHHDGERFVNYGAADGLGLRVRALAGGHDGRLWVGTEESGVWQLDGTGFRPLEPPPGTDVRRVQSLVETAAGDLWIGGIDRGLTQVQRPAGGSARWRTFTPDDGLPHSSVSAIAADPDGGLWLGTGDRWRGGNSSGNGVSFFDFDRVLTLTTEDGLPSNGVMTVEEDSQGRVWFGTWDGVAYWDGQQTRPIEELQDNTWSITEDGEGGLWVSTQNNGSLARWDDGRIRRFTADDGAPGGYSLTATRTRGNDLWFATTAGAARYDGTHFAHFDTAGGLPLDGVNAVCEDADGHIWLGTRTGLAQLDGRTGESLGLAAGLPMGGILALATDRSGHLWIANEGGGLTRYGYDGSIRSLQTNDLGLGWNIWHIMVDRRDHLWLSTDGGGLVQYDGRVFQSLLKGDILPHDTVQESAEARDGSIWIATEGGVVRYRPSRTPPPIRITNVIADREWGPVSQVGYPSTQGRLAIEFAGTSLRTRPNQMVYLYRLQGHDRDWLQTRQRQVVYRDLAIGEYRFEVQAVDRDLNYSEAPAQLLVTVHPPYAQLAVTGALVLSLAGLALAATTARRRRRERDRIQQQLLHDMEEELQTAHQMQMDLLPRQAPALDGYRIAGRAAPANHVGGDYFQYFERDGLVTICLADTTGHAMEAAIPAVMSSGILDKQMEIPGALRDRFDSLNRSCCRSLRQHTYVCLAMLDLDPVTGTMQVGNCGCPYPLHFRASTGEIEEVQVEAYPLGVRPDTEYRAIEVSLLPGDYVVLHSDGFSEASDANQQMFGFDRTMEVVRQGCSDRLSPEDLIERLLVEVKAFTGDEPQADDMTCVVIKVEG